MESEVREDDAMPRAAECETPCEVDAQEPGADEPEELTPEQVAELEAAEKARRDEEAAAERRAAEQAERERRAAVAVETLGRGAGFVTSGGVYYDASRGVRGVEVPPATLSDDERDTATQDGAEDVYAEDASHVDEGDELFARRVAKLTASVARNPLQREIFYKVLQYCEESRALADIEQHVAGLAAFAHAASSPYHFIKVLEQAGGLTRFELDEDGEPVTPERKEGLTEDEVDDLVAGYAFMTTPEGMAVVEQHAPRARLIELLDLVPERRDAYVEVLEFLSEEPRTYGEVCQLLEGRDVLVRMVDGEPQTMQPSVFLDKLEAAAAVEWQGGWVLTEEGHAYLAELHKPAS